MEASMDGSIFSRMSEELILEKTVSWTSCRRTPHCIDVLDNVAALGTSNYVSIIDYSQGQPPRISDTFLGHTKPINCVKWIRSPNENYLLSGSIDKTTIVWRWVSDSSKLKPILRLKSHSLPVNFVTGIYCEESPKNYWIATCSADSTLKIWNLSFSEFNNETITEIEEPSQTFDNKNGFALCADFQSLTDRNGLILATGHDDFTIRIHVLDYESGYNPYPRCNILYPGKVNLFQRQYDPYPRCNILYPGKVNLFPRPYDPYPRCNILYPGIVNLFPRQYDPYPRCNILYPAHKNFYLASCAQDNVIRLWNFTSGVENAPESVLDIPVSQDLEIRPKIFSLTSSSGNSLNIGVRPDAVLCGHDSWVYSIRWHPERDELLSASLDGCVIVWAPDLESGVWIEQSKLGQIGGAESGYFGAVFLNGGECILANSYHGGLHLWIRNTERSWAAVPVCSGHFDAVEDLDWDKEGRYLISTGLDQTTRLYAPWNSDSSDASSYHELARPQVHGHSIQCLAVVNETTFVSGAEEKIVRAFRAPQGFVSSFQNIVGPAKPFTDIGNLPQGASVPALGLSNKAVFENGSGDTQEQEENAPRVSEFHATKEPPVENVLATSTLWPEIHKLYGHGFELYSVASNKAGTIVASASKGTKPEHCEILLWDTVEWQKRSHLTGHSLTVTEIRFSPDDRYVLSVSRDRTWTLYENQGSTFEWEKIGFSDKSNGIHTRIIWCSAWSPDSLYFATGSRDKKVILWKTSENDSSTSLGPVTPQKDQTLKLPEAVTALDFAPQLYSSGYVMALGLESGEISLWKWSCDRVFTSLFSFNRNQAHSLTVKRLRFRTKDDLWERKSRGNIEGDNGIALILASCSSDHFVKTHFMKLEK